MPDLWVAPISIAYHFTDQLSTPVSFEPGTRFTWYPGKTGAICDLVLERESLRIAGPPIPATWDCALTRVAQRSEIDLREWAIDQPLVVSNEQGCRPVDVDLMRALMGDFQVGAHTANLGQPPWQPGAPIRQFLRALEEAGYRHDPMAVPRAISGRFYFECYPHPALIVSCA